MDARIRTEAARLFYHQGYGSSSIRDLAAAVGISSSTLYHYYPNKEAILTAIIESFMHDFNGALIPILEDRARPPDERVRATVVGHIVFSQRRRSELLDGQPFRYVLGKRTLARIVRLQRDYRDAMSAVLVEGTAAGVFRVADPTVTTMLLLDALNGLREWYRPGGSASLEALAGTYADLALRVCGLAPAGGYTGARRGPPMSSSMNSSSVDAFLERQGRWKPALTRLRDLLGASGMTETLKWGKPCYALDGKNVALLHGFKEYCAVLFHKGSLLKDPAGILVQQTENVQAARQLRFTSLAEVERQEKTIESYVREAMEIERAGLRVQFKETKDMTMPAELESELAANARLRKAFAALTPGRQRCYIFHFAQPKLPKTRAARVEKNVARILGGLGLDD